MNHYPFWYNFVFLLVELIQAVIGLVTLTFYRPALTVSFAKWYYRHCRQSYWAVGDNRV